MKRYIRVMCFLFVGIIVYTYTQNENKDESLSFVKMIASNNVIYGMTEAKQLYAWRNNRWNLISSQVRGEKIAAAPDGTLYTMGKESSDCGPNDDGDICLQVVLGWVIYTFDEQKKWTRIAIVGEIDVQQFFVLNKNDFLIVKGNGEVVRGNGNEWKIIKSGRAVAPELPNELHEAIKKGEVSKVEMILKKGNISSWVESGIDTLIQAIWYGRLKKDPATARDMIKLLLDFGADPNATEAKNFIPLQEAIWDGDVALVELLLKKGADANLLFRNDLTSLHQAVTSLMNILSERQYKKIDQKMEHMLEIMKLLISYGAKKDSKVLFALSHSFERYKPVLRTPKEMLLYWNEQKQLLSPEELKPFVEVLS